MESRTKKRLGVVVGGLVLLVGAGVALAAYLSTGAGTASATSSTAVSSTITPGSTGTALYPGSTSNNVTVVVNNPNPYPSKVTGISGGSSNAVGTSGSCAAGTVTTAAVPSPPATVIAANGTGTYTLTASMIANPDNSCQGQTFTVPLTAQLASAAG